MHMLDMAAVHIFLMFGAEWAMGTWDRRSLANFRKMPFQSHASWKHFQAGRAGSGFFLRHDKRSFFVDFSHFRPNEVPFLTRKRSSSCNDPHTYERH